MIHKKKSGNIFLCVGLALLLASPIFAKDLAVVVTIQKYQDPWLDLKDPENYNGKMVSFLQKEMKFKEKEIVTLKDKQATLANLQNEFSKIKKADRLFVYFSGITSRASIKGGSPKNTMITYDQHNLFWDELLGWVDKIKAREKIILIDGFYQDGLVKNGLLKVNVGQGKNARSSQWTFSGPRGMEDNGFLSGLFLAGATKKADGDGNQVLSYTELLGFIRKGLEEKGVRISAQGASLKGKTFRFLREGLFVMSLEGPKIRMVGGKDRGVIRGSLFEVWDSNKKVRGIVKVTSVGENFSGGYLIKEGKAGVGNSLHWLAVPLSDWKIKLFLSVKGDANQDLSAFENLIKRRLRRNPRISFENDMEMADKIILVHFSNQKFNIHIKDSFSEKTNQKFPTKGYYNYSRSMLKKAVNQLAFTLRQYCMIRGLEPLKNPEASREFDGTLEVALPKSVKRGETDTGDSYYQIKADAWKPFPLHASAALISIKQHSVYRFHIKAYQKGYLYIINLDSNGKFTLLFPNKKLDFLFPEKKKNNIPMNFLKPNETLTLLPSQSDGISSYQFVQDTRGTLEYIKIIFTAVPLIALQNSVDKRNPSSKDYYNDTNTLREGAKSISIQRVNLSEKKKNIYGSLSKKEMENLLFLKGWSSLSISLKGTQQ